MRPTPFAAGALAAGLLLSACGGGGETTSTGATPDAGTETSSGASPADLAEENAQSLQSTDDGRTSEVLNIADGSITSLQEAVTGDRPVLLWFWAPH